MLNELFLQFGLQCLQLFLQFGLHFLQIVFFLSSAVGLDLSFSLSRQEGETTRIRNGTSRSAAMGAFAASVRKIACGSGRNAAKSASSVQDAILRPAIL